MEAFLVKYAAYAGLFVLILEFILGKTKLVKANSALQSALNVLGSVVKFVFRLEQAPKALDAE